MKQTLAYDWCILILVSLAFRETLKDDFKRWMLKDCCYARNTESGCKVICIELNFASLSVHVSAMARVRYIQILSAHRK